MYLWLENKDKWNEWEQFYEGQEGVTGNVLFWSNCYHWNSIVSIENGLVWMNQ